MNFNWKRVYLTCIAALLLSGIPVSATDLAYQFYSVTKKNVIIDHREYAQLYPSGALQKNLYEGILALKATDMDGDGYDELLTIFITQNDEQANTNLLLATIYKLENNQFKKSDSMEIASDVLCSDVTNCDVFLKESGKKIYLCCEDKEVDTFGAGGIDWQFTMYDLKNAKFKEVADLSLNGSSLKERALKKTLKSLSSNTIKIDDIIDTPIMDQLDDNTQRLCRISRYQTEDYMTVLTALNSGISEMYTYGMTVFHDYANNEYENIEHSAFSRVVEPETVYYGNSENNASNESYGSVSGSSKEGKSFAERFLELLMGFYEKNDTGTKPYSIWNTHRQDNITQVQPTRELTDPYDYMDYSAYWNEFVIPDSDSRYISESELWYLSEYEIGIARNEIYARHGRGFQLEDLQNYFNNCTWYRRTVDPQSFTETYAAKVFNVYEISNIDTIRAYENAHGLNQ